LSKSSSTRTLYIFALLLVAAVVGCTKDKSTNPPADTTADVTIQIVANNGSDSFSPSPAIVRVGQTVAWHNAHNMAHTATANAGEFGTSTINAGATSIPIIMNTVGSFAYHCGLHPSMVGTLQVTP
jgi:plastocyanin